MQQMFIGEMKYLLVKPLNIMNIVQNLVLGTLMRLRLMKEYSHYRSIAQILQVLFLTMPYFHNITIFTGIFLRTLSVIHNIQTYNR